MDAEAQESFREFVANRSSALLKTAVLLSGGDRHAGEDLLRNALIKAAGRWHRIDEPEAYVRQVLYRQQIGRWRLKWRGRELGVAEPPDVGADEEASAAAELRPLMRGPGSTRRTTGGRSSPSRPARAPRPSWNGSRPRGGSASSTWRRAASTGGSPSTTGSAASPSRATGGGSSPPPTASTPTSWCG
ncbi:SigE family RNA polymerase sigma factor [Streptomyces viridosporus]|uniref:hypothetical protein n=1 Tax=Streptomyces viridosporus TaxID=67581 RepID=UPI0036F5A4CF